MTFSETSGPPKQKNAKLSLPPPVPPTKEDGRLVLENYARVFFAKQVDAEDVLWAFRGIRRQVVWSLKASTQIGCLLLGLRMEDG